MKHNPLVTILLACVGALFSSESDLADPYVTVWHGSQAYYLHRSGRCALGLTIAESGDSAQSIQEVPKFLEEYIKTHKETDLAFYQQCRNKKTDDHIKNHNQQILLNRKKS